MADKIATVGAGPTRIPPPSFARAASRRASLPATFDVDAAGAAIDEVLNNAEADADEKSEDVGAEKDDDAEGEGAGNDAMVIGKSDEDDAALFDVAVGKVHNEAAGVTAGAEAGAAIDAGAGAGASTSISSPFRAAACTSAALFPAAPLSTSACLTAFRTTSSNSPARRRTIGGGLLPKHASSAGISAGVRSARVSKGVLGRT